MEVIGITPVDIIAEWLKDHWPNTALEITNTQIVVHWPSVLAKNGCSVLTKLTLTIPEKGLFWIDGICVCDPKFFDQLETHMNNRHIQLRAAIDQYLETFTLPEKL